MLLKITNHAWDTILTYTDLCPHEISGLGKIEMVGGDFLVTDIAIFEQQVSSAHSTIEPKSLAKFQSDKVKKGESMKQWCLWWHSHANMEVFFSGTDTGTIDESSEFPYLVSLVVNKKHEREARLDLFKPFRMTAKLDVSVVASVNDKLKKICQSEINKKVIFPKVEKPDASTWGWRSSKIPFDKIPPFNTKLDATTMAREQEFREHRKYLIKTIHKAKRHGTRADLQRAQRGLSEWDSWGQGLGLLK